MSNNALLVRKMVERLARDLVKPNTGDGQFIPDDESWKVKSSNMHSSDADWYVGFGDDDNTANESANEYDPKTGELMKNNTISNHLSYLQQWDSVYSESDEEERDNGVGYLKLAADSVTNL